MDTVYKIADDCRGPVRDFISHCLWSFLGDKKIEYWKKHFTLFTPGEFPTWIKRVERLKAEHSKDDMNHSLPDGIAFLAAPAYNNIMILNEFRQRIGGFLVNLKKYQ